MSLQEMFSKLENVKRIVVPVNYEVLGFSDLIELIIKENKSQNEKEIIKKIYKYISTIKESVQNLGQKILELHDDCDKEYPDLFIYSKDNLEGHTKDIIYSLDQFIDSVAALNRTYYLEESRYELNKIEMLLRSNRDIVLKKANSYRKEKAFRTYTDSTELLENYKNFLEDIIDIIIREAMKLSIVKFYDKMKKYMDGE